MKAAKSPWGLARFGALVDLALSGTALAAWEVRFGRLGPNFNADAAVHGAMVIWPIDQNFIYYWGQGRLGSVVPLLGKVLHAIPGVGAAEAVQVAAYTCSAMALLLALGLLRSLPAKLLLFALCAFPTSELAAAFLTAGQPYCALFLFSVLEIRALLLLLRGPSFREGAWVGLAAGALLWTGEPGLFLLLAQLPLLILLVWRSPGPVNRRVAFGTLAGLVLPTAVIIVGKWHRGEAAYRGVLHLHPVMLSLLNLGTPLRPLASVFGPAGLMCLSLLAAGVAALALHRWGRAGGMAPTLGAVGLAPLLGFLGIAASRWFQIKHRAPRYLAYPTLLALLSLALMIDAVAIVDRPRWRPWLGAAGALGLGTASAIVNLGAGDTTVAEGPRWLARAHWLEGVGCRSVIAGYWDSYPYYALSDGRVLATPNEEEYVRNPALARMAVAAPMVCVLPWWPAAEKCRESLQQFGTPLRLQDEIIGHVSVGPRPDEQPVRVCRYVHPS